MKKTQVALAALALVASTATMAEVKLSGVFDVGVGRVTKNAAGVGGVFMEQGNLSDHSSIALDASEDLGSGMKAYMHIESGFDANGYNDNGGTAGSGKAGTSSIWNRDSFVGVSGEFGSIQLGKQLSPFILSGVLNSSSYVGSFAVNRLYMGHGAAGVAAGGVGLNSVGFFIANAVQYISPSISGWTIRAMTTTASGTHGNSINEGTTAQDADRYTSYSIMGSLGSANINAAYENRKSTYTGYNAGVSLPVAAGLVATLGYMNTTAEGSSAIGSYNIGASYELTDSTKAILQYAASDNNGGNKTLTNLTLTNSLSKSTTIYATYAVGDGINPALGNFGNAAPTTGTANAIIVGVSKSF